MMVVAERPVRSNDGAGPRGGVRACMLGRSNDGVACSAGPTVGPASAVADARAGGQGPATVAAVVQLVRRC